MAKLSLDEFQKKRAEAKNTLYLRDSEYQGKIIVHMGTCGIAAGAGAIYAKFLNEAKKNSKKDILFITTACAGFCSQEPMATIELRDQPPVKYGNLNAEKVEKIFNEHVLRGQIVKKFAIGMGSERGD